MRIRISIFSIRFIHRRPSKIFAALGPQSVYTGEVIVYLPMRVKTAAAVGDISISGKLTWQACNDHTCFAPSTESGVHDQRHGLSRPSEPVTPANLAILPDFDPRIFATGTTRHLPSRSRRERPSIFSAGHSTIGRVEFRLALVDCAGGGVLFN